MTENDYIAEYVKENCPQILGIDFCMWKFNKQFTNFLQAFPKALDKAISESQKGVIRND